MNFNDEGTLTLKGETTQFDNQLKELNSKAKELKATLKEIETTGAGKGSQEWKDYKTQLEAVRASQAALNAEMKKMDVADMTLGQLKNHIKDLNKELTTLVPNTKAFNDAAKRLGEAEKQFDAVKKQVVDIKKGGEDLAQPSMWDKISGGVGKMATAFNAFIALAVVQYIFDIGKAIFETTSKFEKYEKVLQTALGSEKLAAGSMAALKELAAKSAFSMDELTEGYVKMVNRGMRPSQAEMVKMTDLAASQGKTFDMLVEAALDAQTGEFERLKEFGIRGSKSGDQVTLSFKGMQKVVANTPESIQGALVAFGEMQGVAGQNAKMMETLGGKTSNLGDNFDALKVELGQRLRPVFIFILDLLNNGIIVISYLAKGISTAVTAVIGFWQAWSQFMTGAGATLVGLGQAIGLFMTGNFEAASKAWDQTKAYASATITAVKTTVQGASADIQNGDLD